MSNPQPSVFQTSAPIVLLDLDGTLIDSLSTVQDTLCLTAEVLGKEHPSYRYPGLLFLISYNVRH